MIRRSTWIIVLIFAVLLAVFFWSQQRQTTEPGEPTATSQPRVLTVDPGDIIRLTMSGESGTHLVISRGEDGTWTMEEPQTAEVDQSSVSTVLSQVSTLDALNQLQNELDKQAIGLRPPAYEVMVEMTDGTQISLSIGTKTVTGSGYYVQVNNNQVYVVSTMDVESLLEGINDPDYLLPPTPTPEPTPESG